jgi:ADP-heptose:LPS heptosyltransferase
LLDALLQLGDWQVVLVGSPDERAVNEAVLQGMAPAHRERVHNAAGELSLGGTLALLTRTRLLITTDSGLMHFAAALGVDTVSLWGPGWPGSYAPRGAGHRAVCEAIYCSPCLYMADEPPCAGDNQCLKRLPVAKVLEAAAELLGIEADRLPQIEEPSLRTDYLPGYVARRSVVPEHLDSAGGRRR